MPHIQIANALPGITGLLAAFPETAKPLTELAEVLLRKDTPTLTKAERETVATYVSHLNGCQFCTESHAAVADRHWGKSDFSRTVSKDIEAAPLSDRLKALLRIAGKLQRNVQGVAKADVDAATKLGATEKDIHDTVLIAAAFCMFNRYVDGLGTFAPAQGDEFYQKGADRLANTGYLR